MATVREQAREYKPATTKNVSELDRVDVMWDIKEKVVNEGEPGEFRYLYLTVGGEEYRVPISVIKQLQQQLESNPGLKYFKVKKLGEGKKTEYTVLPLGGG